MTSDIFMILLIVIGLYFYFLPSIIARKTKYLNGILILNIFLGWTFLGWVAALIWAVSAPKEILKLNNNINQKNNLQDRFVSLMNSIFMKTDINQHTDIEVINLIEKLNNGEAVIKNKLTENLAIVSAEKWNEIILANKNNDYEIIEEK